MVVPLKGPEQLSLSRLIEVTVDDFDLSLKGWRFLLLSVHSQVEPDYMVRLLAKNRRLSIFDERRRLDSAEKSKRNFLDQLAEESADYAMWIRERNFQPLLRDLLVAQCVGFENFLKTVGVASQLSCDSHGTLDKLVFVPSDTFRDAHKIVIKWWKDSRRLPSGVKEFVKKYVVTNRAISSGYSGWKRVDLEYWGPIWDEVFKLRNAVVHSRARPTEQVEIGDEVFRQFDEALITERTLREVDKAFRVVANAFRVSLDDL